MKVNIYLLLIGIAIANGHLEACKRGYYLSNSNCLPCPQECPMSCKDNGHGIGVCFQILTGCNSIMCSICHNDPQSNEICDQCKDPNALPNDVGQCMCNPGTYLSNNACASCPDSCVTCSLVSNVIQCELCSDPTNMQIINGICKCNTHMYLQSDFSCGTCPILCSSCEQGPDAVKCDSCFDNNMKIVNGSCVCEDGYYLVNTQCVQCPLTCDICELDINNPSCTLCHDRNNMIIVNEVCQCKTGYYLNNQNTCTKCDNRCLQCHFNNKEVCDICNTPYIAVGGVCTCKDGFYTLKNNECKECPKEMMCGTCINKGDDTAICQTCKDSNTMILTNGVCHCKDHFYANKNYTCLMCQYPCDKCELNILEEVKCLQCKTTDMILVQNCECKDHKYLSNDKMACLECPAPCTSCVGNSFNSPICKNCKEETMVLSKNCMACIDEYYISADYKQCLKCPDGCLLCKGVDIHNTPSCSKCKDPEHTHINTNNLCECQQAMYFSILSQKCTDCDYRCLNCLAAGHDHCVGCRVFQYNKQISEHECNCDSQHIYSEKEKICRVRWEPSTLIIVLISVVLGLLVVGLIYYSICIKQN
jgi:hypothetical protein